MIKEKKETSGDDWSDGLWEKHGISQEAVFGENGLIAQLKKASRGDGIGRKVDPPSWLRQWATSRG